MEKYKHSLKPIQKLKPGKKCRLKDHWSGVCNQVAGYLDIMAEMDETGERFVFARVPKITSRSKKFKDKTNYSQRAVEFAKRRLRADGVIGPQVTRVRDGILREGVIVASHDSLTSIIGDRCCWHGFTPHHKAEVEAPSSGSSSVQSSGSSSVQSSVQSSVSSSVSSSGGQSAQQADPKSDNPEKAAPSLSALAALPTDQTLPPARTKTGEGGLNKENLATMIHRFDMGAPTSKAKAFLADMVEKHGEPLVARGLKAFATKRAGGQGIDGLRQPWTFYISEAEFWIDYVKRKEREWELADLATELAAKRDGEDVRLLNAGRSATDFLATAKRAVENEMSLEEFLQLADEQEQNIQRQKEEHRRRWDSAPAPQETGGGPEDYLAMVENPDEEEKK